MDSIKKFFDKKKKDAKFKLAGPGQTLSSGGKAAAPRHSGISSSKSASRNVPTSESKKAGAAALARFETHGPSKEVDWSLQAIKAQARREMETEKKLAQMSLSEEKPASFTPTETNLEAAPMLAVQGVYFYCPLLGPEVETYGAIKERIRDFLYGQLGEDEAVAACLIIHTCNKNKDKVSVCVETLCKYIENLLSNPTEEKYRKIRQSNRAYQDRVAPIEGTKEFFEAVGFQTTTLPFNQTTDQFWVFPEENLNNLEPLESIRDTLVSAEPLKPQLDRSLRVLLPAEASRLNDLPSEFFAISVEELKKEQQAKSLELERNQMLMTKAMREKMQLKEIRKYKFTLIRVRFPDGIILQGTFAIHEKFSSVVEFVRENLTHNWRPFFLSISGGGKMSDDETGSLFELHLVPAVLFNFEWDASIHDPNLDDRVFLSDDVMMLLRDQS